MAKSKMNPLIEAVHRHAALLTATVAKRTASLARCEKLSAKQAQAIMESEKEQESTAFNALIFSAAAVLFDPELGKRFKDEAVEQPGSNKK